LIKIKRQRALNATDTTGRNRFLADAAASGVGCSTPRVPVDAGTRYRDGLQAAEHQRAWPHGKGFATAQTAGNRSARAAQALGMVATVNPQVEPVASVLAM